MIKNIPVYLAITVLSLCSCSGSSEQNNNGQDTANNAAAQHDAAIVEKAPDSLEMQINAQDTLFEDGSQPSSWANAGFDNPVLFKQFVAEFKEWVKTDNIDSIAAHIKFPVKAAKTAEVFKSNYASIFNAEFKKVIADQRLNRIFRNVNGAMLANGKIWFTPQNGNYYIIAINR